MSPQLIVPVTGFNEVSGSGLLIGSFYGYGYDSQLTHDQFAANSLIRTAKNVKIYRVSASSFLRDLIPLNSTFGLSRNANTSANNV